MAGEQPQEVPVRGRGPAPPRRLWVCAEWRGRCQRNRPHSKVGRCAAQCGVTCAVHGSADEQPAIFEALFAAGL